MSINITEWLQDYGMTSDMVQGDEDTGYYIMVEPNLMDERENEDGSPKKIYLPTDIAWN